VAVVAAAVLALTTIPAQAHAGVVTRTPADGVVLWSSPATVSVTFTENVYGGSRALVVVNRLGRVLSSNPRIVGTTATASVQPLRTGRFAMVYDVTSDDGHRVNCASGFSIGLTDPPARSRRVDIGDYTVRMSGTRVGTRTITLPWSNAIGEVRFKYRGVPGTFTWVLSRGKAHGMLPFAGVYTVYVNAYTSVTQNYSFTGTVRITA